jgi:hypothetical protein
MRTRLAVLILLLTALSTGPAHPFTASEGDALIKHFLASKKTPDEDTTDLGKALVDLNGDGKTELVLVWAQLGPTYSSTNLTVFVDEGRKYRTLTTPLAGEAKLLGVKGGVILIEQKTLGPRDPRCCPSVVKQVKYRWDGKKIQQLPERGDAQTLWRLRGPGALRTAGAAGSPVCCVRKGRCTSRPRLPSGAPPVPAG